MSDMREYAAQHGWEVGAHLRYAGSTGPSSVITSIEAGEVRISTPGDFPGRLTGGSSSGLEKWTLDWQYRAEQAEAAIQRVRELHRPTDDPDADHDGKWCVECAKGWDGHDFDLIEYPCATIRTINEGESK